MIATLSTLLLSAVASTPASLLPLVPLVPQQGDGPGSSAPPAVQEPQREPPPDPQRDPQRNAESVPAIPASAPGAGTPRGAAATQPPNADHLRQRVHDMRRSLLLGGDRVREAESEAVKFYQQKIGQIDQRLSTLNAEQAEKGAQYELLLERILQAPSAQARRGVAVEAAGLRSELEVLQSEQGEMQKRRQEFGEAATSVQERDRQRERLSSRLDLAMQPNDVLAPLPMVGLAAPALRAPEDALADQGLIEDLLRRDPRRARAVLFELSPRAYFERWPLRPPDQVLLRTLPFPAADLPGRR